MDALESILESDKKYLVNHHIEAYDIFIKEGIRNIVLAQGPASLESELCTIKAYVGGHDASELRLEWLDKEPSIERLRLNNYSYTMNLMASVTLVATDAKTGAEETFVKHDVRIGSIPIMVGSAICTTSDEEKTKECKFDIGGYFLISGKEKVIVSQERGVLNRLFVEKSSRKEYQYTAFARCISTVNKTVPKTLYLHVLSNAVYGGRRKDAIVVDVPGIKKFSIPLFIVFRALGVESDLEILDMISKDEMIREQLRASVVDGNAIYSRDEALEFLKAHVKFNTRESVLASLLKDFLPQVEDNFVSKARMLGIYVENIIRCCLGEAPLTNRDSYLHKRVSTSGYLISELFQTYYTQFWVKLNIAINNEFNITFKANYVFPFIEGFITPINVGKLFDSSQIQEGMDKSFKGAWGIMESIDIAPELGIVQDLSRISYMSYISHLRRVATPFDDKAKVTGPHELSATQWGLMCPTETPDGRNVGLLKSLALLSRITTEGVPTLALMEKISTALGLQDLRSTEGVKGVKVFLNEVFIGSSSSLNRQTMLDRVSALRDVGELGKDAGISTISETNSIYIRTDEGRIVRPLFTRDHELVFLDVEEINSRCYLAMSKDDINEYHTHYEIHPCALYSAYTNTIPFFNHNQATRNTFSCAQGKQAIGLHTTKFVDRIDTAAYVLHYPQRPLVETRVSRMLPAGGILNNGENLIVAVACYTGYNMEDAVILNGSSVQRGMFNMSVFKSLFAEEKHEINSDQKNTTLVDIIIGAEDGSGGLPTLNEYIGDGDIAVARTLFEDSYAEKRTQDFILGENGSDEGIHRRSDISVKGDQNHEGFVDGYYGRSLENKGFCKVRLRKWRQPELGDKVASRHGQKGVVGILLPEVDMPFTSQGLIPDIIVNPHAFPSRMTIGHLIEALAAKSSLASSVGSYDGTPFQDPGIVSMGDELVANGYERYGNEVLYNGLSGEQINSDIFLGPTYYYRLKHMVEDKINFRSDESKIVGLTGQPTKGRANDGGMRIGEMERDAILAHGMSGFLCESFGDRSDAKETLQIQDGDFTYNNRDAILVGSTNSKIGNIKCPVSFKLLSQELKGFHIDAKLISR